MDTNLIDKYRKKIASLKEPSTSQEWEEYNKLQPLSTLYKELETVEKQTTQTQELIDTEVDSELKAMAEEELKKLEQNHADVLEKIENGIEKLIDTSDDRDSKDAVLEIRAGTGGEEAALFASDMFRMYSLFAQKKGFSVEVLNQNISSNGGLKEIIARVTGKNVFGSLKYESGVHRVQRIPTTESSGRIHTSTASVAVMPEAQTVDIEIKPEDLKIDTFKASGAGGQHVNKTDSAIRITHVPTGIIVSCQEGRSQHKNKEAAMSLLRTKLYDQQLEEQQKETDSLRREQIGSAMRAEKIRTYNFPQSRITDHRIKKSWHNIDEVLNGNLDEILNELSKK